MSHVPPSLPFRGAQAGLFLAEAHHSHAGAGAPVERERVDAGHDFAGVQAVRRCVLPRASERDQNLSRGELLVQAARDFLHSHFHRNHELVDIAASLGVSPEHLARVFKRLTGQTVLHYREQLRLEQAKALLLSGGQGIAEIAGAVGYASANRFGTRFKAYTGLSPSAFRGRHGTSSHAEPSRIEVIDS